MSVATGIAHACAMRGSPHPTPSANSAGTTMPPTAAITGSSAFLTCDSSPTTSSRLSSSPATKKNSASSPSLAQSPTVRSRCSTAGRARSRAAARYAPTTARSRQSRASGGGTEQDRARRRSRCAGNAANSVTARCGTAALTHWLLRVRVRRSSRRPDFPAHLVAEPNRAVTPNSTPTRYVTSIVSAPTPTLRSDRPRPTRASPSRALTAPVSTSPTTTAAAHAHTRSVTGGTEIASSGSSPPTVNASERRPRRVPRAGQLVRVDAQLGLGVRLERVVRGQLAGDLDGQLGGQALLLVDLGELPLFLLRHRLELVAAPRRSAACSVSRWVETETYSPPAIDSAPATSSATPATRIAVRSAVAPATPTDHARDRHDAVVGAEHTGTQPVQPLAETRVVRLAGMRHRLGSVHQLIEPPPARCGTMAPLVTSTGGRT